MLRLMRLIWRALAFPGHFMQTGCTAGWGEVGHSTRSSFKSVPLCWQKSDASPATRLASKSSTNYNGTKVQKAQTCETQFWRKKKSESMIKIRRQPPKISDLSLINAWPCHSVLPWKNTRFLRYCLKGGIPLPKLYWIFLQVPILNTNSLFFCM